MAVRYFIAILLCLAPMPAPGMEIYECAGANGSLRYTNIKSEAKGCKLLIVLSLDTALTSPSQANPAPKATPVAMLPVAEPVFPAVAYGNTEPSARLQALEEWARGSRETLDPVTYALVDPDESVRARAQELWDQALRRQ